MIFSIPPRNCHSASHVSQTGGNSPRQGARTQPRSRAPAASRPPRLSQGHMVVSLPRNCHSVSRVCVHPASVSGPSSRPRLKIATAPAGSTRPGAQPSARLPSAARGGSIITGPRGASRPPARTQVIGLGTGKSGDGPYALATPPGSRSRAPPAAWCSPRLSQGPMVCYSRHPLPADRGPCRATPSAPTPEPPHIVCSGTMRACGPAGGEKGRARRPPGHARWQRAGLARGRGQPRHTLGREGSARGIRPNWGYQSRLQLSSKGL